MQQTRNQPLRLDPDYYWSRAQEEISVVSKEEFTSWLAHPCTQSLKKSLEGYLAAVASMWLSGAYSDDSNVDVTAQAQAKARGMAACADQILNTIDTLVVKEEENEDASTDGV